jgi:Uma2 family endonuclease
MSSRPRIAPDIAVEVYSPDDRPGRMKRKVETYLEFGSSLVVVPYPKKRRVVLHRRDGAQERRARGAWALAPFDDLVVEWDDVYRDLRLGR